MNSDYEARLAELRHSRWPISRVIDVLAALRDQHGDCPVMIPWSQSGGGWVFITTVEAGSTAEMDEDPCVFIHGGYPADNAE